MRVGMGIPQILVLTHSLLRQFRRMISSSEMRVGMGPQILVLTHSLLRQFRRMISSSEVENVKQRCLINALNYPMLEEYDFRTDSWEVKYDYRYWDLRQQNAVHVQQLPQQCYALSVRHPLMVVRTADRNLIVFNLQNRKADFKRITSPLKYQTRCAAAFPDQQMDDMGLQYQFIRDLEKGKKDCIIRARLTRKWESINPKKNNTLISLDFILLDENGDMIHALIWSKWASKFSHILDEGDIYEIAEFSVDNNKDRYKVVGHEYMIKFSSVTSVKKLAENSVNIAHHKFAFVPFDTVPSRTNNEQLSDVIGRLTALSVVQDQDIDGRSVKKRVIEIEDKMVYIRVVQLEAR